MAIIIHGIIHPRCIKFLMAPRLWPSIGEGMMAGLFSIEVNNHDELFSEVERLTEAFEGPKLFITRLPQRSMLRHISLDDVQCLWITEQQTSGALPPNTPEISKQLFGFVNSNDEGFSVVEGLTWAIQRNGVDDVMHMLQSLESHISGTNHTILFRINALSLDAVSWARIRSIAPAVELPTLEMTADTPDAEILSNQPLLPVEQLSEDGSILAHLTTLPSLGFTNALLSKRMLQWKRMGFDVSELEPALSSKDGVLAHKIYREVEEKIRRAIDLSRLLEEKSNSLSVTAYEVTMFRIMQLTGLDEINLMLQDSP